MRQALLSPRPLFMRDGWADAWMMDRAVTPDDEARNKHVLRHINEWLTFRGLNQVQLADRLGVSEGSVSKYLNGKVPITVARFIEIASFLDAEPAQLMGAPSEAAESTRTRKLAEALSRLDDGQIDALLRLLNQRPNGDKIS